LEACEVEENQGSGMAHFVWDFSNPAIKNPGQDILIHDSAFANNQGEFGGAIFWSNFGTMPKLEVWNARFESNACTNNGGGTASIIGSIVMGEDAMPENWTHSSGSHSRKWGSSVSQDQLLLALSFTRSEEHCAGQQWTIVSRLWSVQHNSCDFQTVACD